MNDSDKKNRYPAIIINGYKFTGEESKMTIEYEFKSIQFLPNKYVRAMPEARKVIGYNCKLWLPELKHKDFSLKDLLKPDKELHLEAFGIGALTVEFFCFPDSLKYEFDKNNNLEKVIIDKGFFGHYYSNEQDIEKGYNELNKVLEKYSNNDKKDNI